MTKETTYQRLMREAKEQYAKEMQEAKKLSVKKLLDHTHPKGK